MTVHIVGSGIASLSAAVYLIEKARVDPHDIIVYEESDKLGGAMAMGKPVEPHNPSEPDFAYVLPATRILEREYRCAKDLLSRFPSKRNHDKNIWDECVEFNNTNPYYDTNAHSAP